jgi:hypothetical protein
MRPRVRPPAPSWTSQRWCPIQGTFVLNDDEDIRAKTAALFQAIVSFGAMARILLRGFELER